MLLLGSKYIISMIKISLKYSLQKMSTQSIKTMTKLFSFTSILNQFGFINPSVYVFTHPPPPAEQI